MKALQEAAFRESLRADQEKVEKEEEEERERARGREIEKEEMSIKSISFS